MDKNAAMTKQFNKKEDLSIWGLKVYLVGEDLYKVEFIRYNGVGHGSKHVCTKGIKTMTHVQRFLTSEKLIEFAKQHNLDYKPLLTEGIKNSLL